MRNNEILLILHEEETTVKKSEMQFCTELALVKITKLTFFAVLAPRCGVHVYRLNIALQKIKDIIILYYLSLFGVTAIFICN